MKIARLARNVILVGLVWRLIALRRAALARERRSRRITPLLITAGGTGVILVARPRILEGTRRLWDVARGSRVARRARPARSQEGKQESAAVAEIEPKSRVEKSRKGMARAEQSEKGWRKSSYGVKGESEDRSKPGTEPGGSLKH
jgi:hypothetical protein